MTVQNSTSLRVRLLVLILVPLVAVSVVLGIWRYQAAEATAEELFDRGLMAAALAISRDVTISEGDALSPSTRQLISDAGGGEVFYHVTGPGGIYVTGYAYPPIGAIDQTSSDPQYMIADYRGEAVRILRMREKNVIGNLSGETIVTVWQRVSDRNAFANSLAIRTVAVMSALLLTLTIVVWFGVQLGLRPLADLQDAIERRSPDDLSRIQRRVPTEVTGIVATLNKLFGQVDDSIQAHQTFISDAAHQLRNPASALLSIAETLPQVTDPVERKKQEAALLSAARKSATLAEQLLSLERLRYSAPKNTQRVDLNEVVQGMCTDLAPKVLSRDIAFQFDPTTADLPADADAVLIGEAVRNLVNNALAHGGPDLSSLTVSTARVGPTALIRVIDDGIGIPPEDAKHAFRRFAQLSSNDGSGLGLSIVQAVAQSHFGTASLETVTKGTSVCITLPVAK